MSNGNKVEIHSGYFTYCGDDVGCVALLGDLTKAEIFEMAKRFPEIPRELLPNDKGIIEMPPSAELKNKQVDPFIWGLDDNIIDKTITYKKMPRSELKKLHDAGELGSKISNFDSHLDWLENTKRRSVWKRVQAPPIVVTSKQAFGYDLREALS